MPCGFPVRSNVADDEDALLGNDLEGTGGDAARVLAEGPAESHCCTLTLLRWSNLACFGADAQTQLFGALMVALRLGTRSLHVERAKKETVADVLTPWVRQFDRMSWRVWMPHCGRCWSRPRGFPRG